eukprot:gene8078-12423_t
MPAFNGPAERVLTVESSVDRVPGCVRLACVSDTHLMEEQVAVPAGDVLVHCGDVLMRSGSVARDEAAAQFAAFAGPTRTSSSSAATTTRTCCRRGRPPSAAASRTAPCTSKTSSRRRDPRTASAPPEIQPGSVARVAARGLTALAETSR